MSALKLTGSCDDVCAQLQANFEAHEAQFNASLQAVLKGQAPSLAAPAAKPAVAKAHPSAGWVRESKGDRLPSRDDAGSLRGRLRTSMRPSR